MIKFKKEFFSNNSRNKITIERTNYNVGILHGKER